MNSVNSSTYIKKSSIPNENEETESNFSYLCHHCGYKTPNPNSCETHIEFHHTLTYKCEQCNYKTNIQTNIKTHMGSNHNTKSNYNNITLKETPKYSCEKCNHETENKSDLEMHIKTTHKARFSSYSCDYCDYKSVVSNVITSLLPKIT